MPKKRVPSNLGEAIRAARAERQWSQPALARRLETGEKNIRNWESGRHYPSYPMYQRMSLLFGWDLPYSGESSTARERSYAALGIPLPSTDLAAAASVG